MAAQQQEAVDDTHSVRGLAASAVIKFNNFFKQNMIKLFVEEAKRDQLSQEAMQAPKYTVCFLDLAEFLGLKDEIMDKVASMNQGEENDVEFNAAALSLGEKQNTCFSQLASQRAMTDTGEAIELASFGMQEKN